MDGAQEVARCFVVARCNGTILLESGKEVLDQVARLVQVSVMAALVLARFEAGNHHRFTGFLQRLDQSLVGIVGSISDDRSAWCGLEQHVCAFQIMGLSGRQVKAGGVSQCIDRRMDFGCQAAAAAPNGLALLRPLFFAPRCADGP